MSTYLGIDWSEAKHDLAFVNEAGAQVAKATIDHSQQGFEKLTSLCQRLAVPPAQCYVAIETKHNLLVDYLWSYGYSQVYVIPPSVVNSCRPRFSSSGARTDASDAYVLADILRTDRHRLVLWKPDSLLTQEMRATVVQVHQLTRQSVVMANQLRALVLRYYPGMLELFPNLLAQTTLAFLVRFPTPAAVAQLTVASFEEFLRERRHSHRHHALARFSCLQQPSIQTEPGTAQIYADSTVRTATLLLQVVQARIAAQRRLTSLFEQHPDHDSFASLPGTGDFLAPALLVKFGDDRQRFPTPAALQALAGTCPVTEASGKYRSVRFRQACDHDFRNFAQQWAIASVVRTHSPFACAYYDSLRRRHIPESHAYRCLANRWLAIGWKLWRTHSTYDEAYHLQQRVARSRPVRKMPL